MIKGTQADSVELTLAEVKIQHQNWLQHPETRMVIQALRRHAQIHTDHAFEMARVVNNPAEACKAQTAIAFNLNHVISIIANPDAIYNLINLDKKTNQ